MKTVVVEDSRLAREGLIRMLAAFPEIEVIGSAANVSDALAIINQNTIELLFLDIHMPEENGFDLLAQLSEQPKVIFTTAYAEYAVQSFDYDTVDYLLKPIRQERLAKAIEKLSLSSQKIESSQKTENSLAQETKLTMDSQIFVKDGEQCYLVPVKSISLIESCKNYVVLYWQLNDSKSTQKAFIKKSLTQVEGRLPKQDFFRANRQFIINLHSVTKIEENMADGYNLTLNNHRLIDVSRRNASKLKELLSL